MSDNVVDLKQFRTMQKALDAAAIQPEELPPMIAYRDIHGMPQLVIEGGAITQQQYDNMPEDVRDLLILQEDE